MTDILKKIIPAEKKTDAEKSSNKVEGLRKSLAKTRSGLLSKLKKVVAGGKVDEDLWESFEEMLILSDVGIKGAAKIRKRVEAQLSGANLSDYEKIKNSLVDETARILKNPARAEAAGLKPRICMVVGVNGTGKTTTAGKLADLFSSRGEKVMLAAADTFRAAATEQLEQWALRSGSEFIKGKPGTDPSAIAFDAVKTGQEQNCDTVIIDTAGRLHTKTNLMDELSKIKRVVGKAREGAPDDVFLVLDATTGQNAIRQTEMFNSMVGITDIVLTKIDGTAKGGVVIAVCEEFEIPVAYVGTGEGAADITEFEPVRFASGLFDENG